MSSTGSDLVQDFYSTVDLVPNLIQDLVRDAIRNLVQDPIWNLVQDPIWNLVQDPIWNLVQCRGLDTGSRMEPGTGSSTDHQRDVDRTVAGPRIETEPLPHYIECGLSP